MNREMAPLPVGSFPFSFRPKYYSRQKDLLEYWFFWGGGGGAQSEETLHGECGALRRLRSQSQQGLPDAFAVGRVRQ